MSVGNYTYDTTNYTLSGGGQFEQLWNTVLDEYNDPNWFATQIWEPFQDSFSHYNVRQAWRDPDDLLEEYGGYFAPFSTQEWTYLDKMHELSSTQLDRALVQLEEDRVEKRDLEERVYRDQKETAIEMADMELDKILRKTDLEKSQLTTDYKEMMSQIDNLIGHTGMTSGYFEQKKDIQLDNVASNIHQANFSQLIATEEADKTRNRAIDDYNNSLNMSDLKYDAEYNTSIQNVENKKEELGISLVKDKLNVYGQWKAESVNNLTRLVAADTHQYGEDDWSGGGHYDPVSGEHVEPEILSHSEWLALSPNAQLDYVVFDDQWQMSGGNCEVQPENCSYVRVGEAISDLYDDYEDWMGSTYLDGSNNAHTGGSTGFGGSQDPNGFEEWKAENPELYDYYVDMLENTNWDDTIYEGMVHGYSGIEHSEDFDLAQDYTILQNFIFDQLYLNPVREGLAEDYQSPTEEGDYGVWMPYYRYDSDGDLLWYLRNTIANIETSFGFQNPG